jgi:hypothetical protein
MLIILEEIIPKFDELLNVADLVDIKRLYVKQLDKAPSSNVIEEDPVVIQTISQRPMNSNAKYNAANSVFQRFSARVTQEGTENFNMAMQIFTMLTESLEQNKIKELYDRLNPVHNEIDQYTTSIPTTSTACTPKRPTVTNIVQTPTTENNSPCPFKLVHCTNPVGRPKGSRLCSATSFKLSSIKRKAISALSKVNSKRTRSSSKTTKTTTKTTTTTTTTTTTITEINEQDKTLDDIEEFDSVDDLEKNIYANDL